MENNIVEIPSSGDKEKEKEKDKNEEKQFESLVVEETNIISTEPITEKKKQKVRNLF